MICGVFLMKTRKPSKRSSPNAAMVLWGVYRFKRGFGGELKRAVQAMDRVYNPLLYKLYLWRMAGREAGMMQPFRGNAAEWNNDDCQIAEPAFATNLGMVTGQGQIWLGADAICLV